MMVQQAHNNIFVREWILQVKDSANQVWATIDWVHARKIRKHNLKGITFLGQVRGWSVLIFTQVYLSRRCFFFFFQITSPFFHGDLSFIYSCYFQFWTSTCWSRRWRLRCLSHQKPSGNFVSNCELRYLCREVIST